LSKETLLYCDCIDGAIDMTGKYIGFLCRLGVSSSPWSEYIELGAGLITLDRFVVYTLRAVGFVGVTIDDLNCSGIISGIRATGAMDFRRLLGRGDTGTGTYERRVGTRVCERLTGVVERCGSITSELINGSLGHFWDGCSIPIARLYK
jgi:hypothetical protein